jgi:hypothetical protein
MRPIFLGSALLLICSLVPTSEADAQTAPGRTVQVITMAGMPMRPAEATQAELEKGTVQPVVASSAAPLAPAFENHDLSRRWVAFEMANSFSAANGEGRTAPAYATSQFPELSPLPVITIPRWMTAEKTFSAATESFSAGCSSVGYRPSGFLDWRTEYRRLGYYGMMSSIACEYGIPVALFDAMIIRESGYRADIYSSKKAFGLTQLMSNTAAGLGVDRYDIEQNLRGGARYLRQQLDRFGAVHLALAAYNAGPNRVKDGFVPRIAETRAYVDNILTNWQRLTGSPRRATIESAVMKPVVRPASLGRIATVSSY